MICIKSKTPINELVNKHWEWLSKKIRYSETKNKTIDECKKVLKDKKKTEHEKKECALKVVIGEELYANLEKIIKGDLDYLKRIKEEKPLFFLDSAKFFEKKEELKSLSSQIKIKEKDIKTEEDELILDDLNKKYEECQNDCKLLKEQLEKKTTQKYTKKDGKEVSVDLIKLLRYESLHSKDSDWNAHILCDSLGVSVCPYCNRQYIFVTQKKEGGWISSAQLDHFLPKDSNPLFSCSFFNLIPSCYCCNHGKSDDFRETIYPYKDEFGEEGVFRVVFPPGLSLDEIDFTKDVGIDIEIDSQNKHELIENSIDVFHLKELYNMHQLDLKDFIKRFNCCKTCRQQDYANVILDETEWNDTRKRDLILGLPLDAAEIEYPLKKMKKDILKQLEEIEKIKL